MLKNIIESVSHVKLLIFFQELYAKNKQTHIVIFDLILIHVLLWNVESDWSGSVT